MSLIPEFIFRTVIVRGIRQFRDDTRLLDQLFRNLDQQSAADMREFFLKNKIYIDMNYPREALKLPAIIMLLKSESESQAYLGDSMGIDCEPEQLVYDDFIQDELADEILGGAASMSTSSGLGPVIFGPAKAASGTANTLRIAVDEGGFDPWKSSEYAATNRTVHIIGGTGVGQQRAINANGTNTLMVAPNWQIVPDDTTVFVIRDPVKELVGEPRALYNKSGAPTERLGSMYALSYQVQIIGPNPELTIYLHAIVKSILTLSRTFLEGQGVINMQMGATDFLPRSEYQPDHAYMRALNLDFQYPFDIFSELGDLATSFRLVLEQCTKDGVVILSDTTC